MNMHELKEKIDTLEKVQKDKIKALRLAKKELLKFESAVDKEFHNISQHNIATYDFIHLKSNLLKELDNCLIALADTNQIDLIKNLELKLSTIKGNLNE